MVSAETLPGLCVCGGVGGWVGEVGARSSPGPWLKEATDLERQVDRRTYLLHLSQQLDSGGHVLLVVVIEEALCVLAQLCGIKQ